MLSDGPPSREAVTTSLTWPDSVDVNTFTSSGIRAPATVPHVMMVDSFHQSVPSPMPATRKYDTAYVMTTDTIDVSQTSDVRGASKFILSALPERVLAYVSFGKTTGRSRRSS
jgi:hypothetical protein